MSGFTVYAWYCSFYLRMPSSRATRKWLIFTGKRDRTKQIRARTRTRIVSRKMLLKRDICDISVDQLNRHIEHWTKWRIDIRERLLPEARNLALIVLVYWYTVRTNTSRTGHSFPSENEQISRTYW